MPDKPIPTSPMSSGEHILREKYYEAIAGQSDLMDRLAERLLTLELAIPGLYATALKLIAGDDAVVTIDAPFYLAFIFWLIALVLLLAAMFPRRWKVIPTLLRQAPGKRADGLGIQDFFEQTAAYKRVFLMVSSLFLFAGIVAAAFNGSHS